MVRSYSEVRTTKRDERGVVFKSTDHGRNPNRFNLYARASDIRDISKEHPEQGQGQQRRLDGGLGRMR